MALAVATFWPLQFVAGSLQLGHQEYNMFLHGLAFFISACLFTGGLEAMRRANNTPQADSWEFLG
jgi:high-affinity Fe2+/Pb2+ permease